LDHKAPDAFRTISEVADELDLPQHVLRFWESRFREIKPMKRGGGRRFYRPDDIELLRGIRHLLYGEGYTIRGVQRILREQGIKFVQAVWMDGAAQPPHGASDEEEFADEAINQPTDHAADQGIDGPSDPLGEGGGLRRRFASLIGRDLGDRQDDAASRRDPPLHSAPELRIEPDDRMVPSAPSFAPRQPLVAEAAAAPVEPAGLGAEDLRKLRAALNELTECRKLIDAVMQPAES
jgi:DNA-binding transcriptional MerR regulator